MQVACMYNNFESIIDMEYRYPLHGNQHFWKGSSEIKVGFRKSFDNQKKTPKLQTILLVIYLIELRLQTWPEACLNW